MDSSERLQLLKEVALGYIALARAPREPDRPDWPGSTQQIAHAQLDAARRHLKDYDRKMATTNDEVPAKHSPRVQALINWLAVRQREEWEREAAAAALGAQKGPLPIEQERAEAQDEWAAFLAQDLG